MRTEERIINVIFDAGRGTTSTESREARVGQPYGALPVPIRRGYDFEGWFLDGVRVGAESVVESETDVLLEARWVKKKTSGALHSALKKQYRAIAFLLALTLLLSVALVGIRFIVSIYGIEDVSYSESGEKIVEKYYVRKKNGVYGLYNRAGEQMPTNSDGYFIAASGNQYEIDAESGAYELYARVDYEGSETSELKQWLLMFPQISQETVYSIEVNNTHGRYKFFRAHEGGAVQIEGLEESMILQDDDQYARLCVGCGYPLTLAKLNLASPEIPRRADGSVNLAAYGLEPLYDETGAQTYTPTTFTITQSKLELLEGRDYADRIYEPSEVSYTVTVGYKIPSGSGLYARVEGRNAIYVLNSDLEYTVFAPLEDMVQPAMISPLALDTFTEVRDFMLGTADLSTLNWDELSDEAFDAALESVDIQETVTFSFRSLLERSNTIYSATPYVTDSPLMKGYAIDDDRISEVLGNLLELTNLTCKKVGLTAAAMKEYGMSGNVYLMTYMSPLSIETSDGGTDTRLVSNSLIISPRTPQETYYVASVLYDMIVEVEAYQLDFLAWSVDQWYATQPCRVDINHLKEWSMTVGGTTYEFSLDNSLSYAYYYDNDGTPTMVDLSKGTIAWTGDQFRFHDGGTYRTLHYVDFENGDFYRDQNGKIRLRLNNGKELLVEQTTKRMMVVCKQYKGTAPFNEHVVDYKITYTFVNDVGQTETEKISAEDNFRTLYSNLYFLSIEGRVDETEFKDAKGKTVEEFIKSSASETPYATVRFRYEDHAAALNRYVDADGNKLYTENNRGEVVLRFYKYTARKSLMTLELVENYDENGEAILDPTKANGCFYVLTSVLDEMLKDAKTYVAGERVVFEN